MVFLSPQNFADILKPDADSNVPPHTKVICTLGPASSSVDILEQLLRQGVSVARFDASWADEAWCRTTIVNLREAEKRSGRRCAVMLDTAGPELAVMNVSDTDVTFPAGSSVTITTDKGLKLSAQHIPVAYSMPLIQVGFQQGATLYVDEYLAAGDNQKAVVLTVDTVGTNSVTCTVHNECKVSGGAQLRLHGPNLRNEMPILSDRDRQLIVALKSDGLDFVCLSYCRSGEDVSSARDFLQENAMSGVQLVAKIANKEGLVNHKSIIANADAVLIARGHLGVDLAPEKVFVAQKMVVRAANIAGKTVLSARVVDTMVHAPRPTRAEATDVANLVLDGTDGIMLGSETFKGSDPVLAATTVLSICRQAERCYDSMEFYNLLMDTLGGFQQANLTKVVAEHPENEGSAQQVVNQLLMLRSVIPLLASATHKGPMAVDGSMTDWALEQAMQMGLVSKGDGVVVSQCPKINRDGKFDEAGVVKFLVAGTPSGLPPADSMTDVRTLIGLE